MQKLLNYRQWDDQNLTAYVANLDFSRDIVFYLLKTFNYRDLALLIKAAIEKEYYCKSKCKFLTVIPWPYLK